MHRSPNTTIRDYFPDLQSFQSLLNSAIKETRRPGKHTPPRDLSFLAGLEYAVERYGIGAIITQRDITRLNEIINPPEIKRIHLPPQEQP